MKDAEKKKALEKGEGGSKGEMTRPNSCLPNDSLVQTRIIETVITTIENELSPTISKREQIQAVHEVENLAGARQEQDAQVEGEPSKLNSQHLYLLKSNHNQKK